MQDSYAATPLTFHGQTEPGGRQVISSLLREVMQTKGLRGLWTGAHLRAAYYVPSACIQYATFETLVARLSRWL